MASLKSPVFRRSICVDSQAALTATRMYTYLPPESSPHEYQILSLYLAILIDFNQSEETLTVKILITVNTNRP